MSGQGVGERQVQCLCNEPHKLGCIDEGGRSGEVWIYTGMLGCTRRINTSASRLSVGPTPRSSWEFRNTPFHEQHYQWAVYAPAAMYSE